MKTTKELAKELGLLRRRTIASSRDAHRGEKQSGQEFKYLIVIDFESTCWKEGKFRTQEIIEFPAVLLNTDTGEVESEFHYYVQPQEQPVLSGFCTELTGITQEQVDDGIPLNFCLRKFRYWLNKLYSEKGVICTGAGVIKTQQAVSNTTCVTWSDWDLGVCLQYECKRKQLLKPPELTSWIDLRATYRKFYQRKPNGLNGALQDVGINFQGRQHSGVDDARNTAKLAYRLIKDGCQLKITKSLKFGLIHIGGKSICVDMNHERSSSCNPTIGLYFKPETTTTKQDTCISSLKPGNESAKPGSVTIKQDTGTCESSMNPANPSVKQGKSIAKAAAVTSESCLKPVNSFVVSDTCRSSISQGNDFSKPANCSSIPDTNSTKEDTSHLKEGSGTCLSRPHGASLESPKRMSSGQTPSKIPRPVRRVETPKCVILDEKKCNITNVQSKSVNKNMAESCRSMTPVKSKFSGKRKEITPLKVKENDIAVTSSPLRKAPRKFTPKKVMVEEVFMEKSSKTSKTSAGISRANTKAGLIERNVNILQKHYNSVTSKNSGHSIDACSEPKTVFKKPSPIGGRIKRYCSPKSDAENTKDFCASTPVGFGGAPKPFFSKDMFSPVMQAKDTDSKITSNSTCDKTQTPFGIGKSTYNSSTATPFGSAYSNKTPSFSRSTVSYQGSFVNQSSNNSSMKMTPPLCKCGRRSTRRTVQSPGPNMGRFFFTCSVRRGPGSKDGCDFFKWEVAASTPRLNSFVAKNGSSISRQFTPVLNIKTPNDFQKRNLGVRPAFKTPMCIR